jgi:tetratricopeptide (TPR) repeat protein
MKRSILAVTIPLLIVLAACTRDPKEVARKYVETGNKYYDRGKYKEASIMYRRALQKNMRDSQAHYRLGLVELKEGMMGEARRSFLRATDIDRGNMDALAKLGEINLAIYAYEPVTYKAYLADVKDVTKRILAKDAKSYDGLRLSGFIAYAEKDLPGAIQKFREANAVKPDQPDLMLALSRTLYASNQSEEAERVAKDLIVKHKDFGPIYDLLYARYASMNRVADAEDILKQKAANSPGNPDYQLQLAFHYFLTKRPDEMTATLARLTSDTKKFPQAHMMAGDFLMRVGSVDRALREYQQGEKVDTKNKAAYGKREAEALALQGKNTEAANVVSQLVKDNPKDPETVAMHASVMIASKDSKQIQKAIDELQPMVASTPANQTAMLQMLHYNLGRAYMAKGDATSMEQARLQFQETLKLNASHTPARLALSELLLARGESAKAVQAADEVIKLQPNNLRAHLLRTMGLMNIGEGQRAREELTAILKASPSSNDARYQLALLDMGEKHYKEAEASFDTMFKANDPRGIVGLVRCKAAQGDINGAIQLAKDQVRRTPDKDDYRRLLVETEFVSQHYDDALADFQPLVQKDPSAVNYVRLGEMQRQSKQYDAAIASFKKAQQLLPNEAMPVLEMALVYDFSGRPEEARQGYEQVLKLQPDNPAALNNLAYSMADQGVDLEKALSYAERARAKMPNDLDVSDTIALIYLRKNQIMESARVLSDLVSKAPNKATYHLHYATALYQKGDKSAARKELDAASRNSPNDKEKLQIQELRQKLS